MNEGAAGVEEAFEVDARGTRCPRPVIMLAQSARYAAHDTVITVLCTDPASRLDIPAWARMTGNEVVSIGADSGAGEFAVTVRVVRR